MKVTVISLQFGTLGTVPTNIEKRLDELLIQRGIETVQTTAHSRSVRIVG